MIRDRRPFMAVVFDPVWGFVSTRTNVPMLHDRILHNVTRFRQLRILLRDWLPFAICYAIDFLCTVRPQDDLVGIPIGEAIHRDGNQKSDDHSAFAADQEATEKEDAGHPCDQYAGAEHIHSRVVL